MQDFSKLTNDDLFKRAMMAMLRGELPTALRCADELCRPSRARECSDRLAHPRAFGPLRRYSAAELQPLVDRVEQYNAIVGSR